MSTKMDFNQLKPSQTLDKLEKETLSLHQLEEKISRSSQITKGIISILDVFDTRLSRLEDTISPVYNNTDNLQKTQQNIDRTLRLLDNVLSFYNVSSDVEGIVERAPGENGVDLDDYLQSLERLRSAQRYFEKHIPQSVELENVTTLFNKGSDKLNSEFKAILDKHNKPILPVALLDFVNIDGVGDNSNSFPTVDMPASEKNKLIKIADWLLDNGRDEYLTVYGKIRGGIVTRSLTMLRKHHKSESGGRNQGRQEASRKPSTRRTNFERKANKMLLLASQTMEQATGLTLTARKSSLVPSTDAGGGGASGGEGDRGRSGAGGGSGGSGGSGDSGLLSPGSINTPSIYIDSSNSGADNGDNSSSDQEMENYLTCVIALHKLMQMEQSLIETVIPAAHRPRVFELIVRESMDTIVQEGENMVLRAKKCISRHDFSTVLVVFPILRQFLTLKPHFERTLESYDVNVKFKFDAILSMLHSIASRILEDFTESLRSDSVMQLPSDGTVHELTSNVIVFLEQLLDYGDIICIVLGQDPAYTRQLDKLKIRDNKRALLGLYIKKVLVQLNHTLISKSEQYGDVALKAIFRLNNNNYVLKSVQRSELLALCLILEPNCEEYYYNSIQEQKNAYFQSWGKLLNYISTEDSPISINHHEKFRDRDRALIKEKFSGFNREIEDISRVQRGYSIPDVELRESIKRDNKELILPKYNAFYNTFSYVQFTKNPEKYLKHKPDELSAIIDRFFDVAA